MLVKIKKLSQEHVYLKSTGETTEIFDLITGGRGKDK